jgi:hypothetical protein
LSLTRCLSLRANPRACFIVSARLLFRIRSDQLALGAGEPSTVTTARAVANAVFDATAIRLPQMPFTPERVRAALLKREGD